ncbi:hypothetical protein H0H92_011972 [Tricholoma furcatifolium]|nr:hypothetical protein H0H92_011972 [Tricholoma furcatifolium]
MSQAVIYFRRYRQDKPLVRAVVWVSLILDTFHFAMVAEVVHFWYIVTGGEMRPFCSLNLLPYPEFAQASVIATGPLPLPPANLKTISVSGNMKLVYLITVVKKLILYTVNIGILTSGASSLTLILWLALPKNFGFISLTLIRSKLYVNSLLVTLNYRKTARKILNTADQSHGTTSRFFQNLDNPIPLQELANVDNNQPE